MIGNEKKENNLDSKNREVRPVFPGFAIIVPIILALLSISYEPEIVESATQQVSQNKTVSAKELMADYKKPSNPVEVLKNIKMVLDSELLLKEDFYTEENLKKVFGGGVVVFKKHEPSTIIINVTHLGDVFEAFKDAHNQPIAVTYEILQPSGKGTRKRGYIGFYSDEYNFTIENAERLWGSNMTFEAHPGTKRGGPPRVRTTHRLGNKKIVYAFETAHTKTVIKIVTDGKGAMRRLQFEQEEK